MNHHVAVERNEEFMSRKKTRRLTVRGLVLEEGDVIVGDDGIVVRPVAGRDHIGRVSKGDRGKGCSGGEEAQWLNETESHHFSLCLITYLSRMR